MTAPGVMPWEGTWWAEVYWARPTTPSLHDLHPRVPLTHVGYRRGTGVWLLFSALPPGFVLEAPGENAVPHLRLPAGRAPQQGQGWPVVVTALLLATGHGDMSSCSHPTEEAARGLSSRHLRGSFFSSGSPSLPSPFGSDELLTRPPVSHPLHHPFFFSDLPGQSREVFLVSRRCSLTASPAPVILCATTGTGQAPISPGRQQQNEQQLHHCTPNPNVSLPGKCFQGFPTGSYSGCSASPAMAHWGEQPEADVKRSGRKRRKKGGDPPSEEKICGKVMS